MKSFNAATNGKKGFTLIELLLVISIIALLSSIVLSNLKSSREKAEIARYQQEVGEFIKAIQLYKSDHGGLAPGDTYCYFQSFDKTNVDNNLDYCELSIKLSPYLKKFPTPIKKDQRIMYFPNKISMIDRYENSYCLAGDPNDYFVVVNSVDPIFSGWYDSYSEDDDAINGKCIQY